MDEIKEKVVVTEGIETNAEPTEVKEDGGLGTGAATLLVGLITTGVILGVAKLRAVRLAHKAKEARKDDIVDSDFVDGSEDEADYEDSEENESEKE